MPAATCGKCGYEPRPNQPHRCPAAKATCRKCEKMGHFERVCRNTAVVRAIAVDPTKPICAIRSTIQEGEVTLSVTALSNEKQRAVKVLPDTGSTLDAVPASLYQQLFSDVQLQAGPTARTATGGNIRSLGSFSAAVDWKADDGVSRPVTTTIHVLVDLEQPVLSKATQKKLGMIAHGYPHVRVHQVSAVTSMPSEALKSKDLQAIIDEFPKVFDGVCRVMKCAPVHLTVMEGAVPVQIQGYRRVAEPLLQMYEDELNLQLAQGLIRKVPAGVITPWIHGTVSPPKDSVSGGVRIAVDLRELNKYLVGTRFPNPTPLEAVRSIPSSMRFFTLFDGFRGYHMVALDEESMALTTFATPYGLHQYTRLPMGICHAGDSFGQRYDDIFGEFFRSGEANHCMEDIVAYSETYKGMIDLNRRIVKRAAEYNVSFNLKKTIGAFAVSKLEFAGFELSGEGYGPSKELTRAISQFPRPLNVTDLRSFNGLCQQVGNHSSQIAAALTPLSPLLKKSNAWDWLPCHEAAFISARKQLSAAPFVSFYDAKRPTALYTDASRLNGLGFILKQQQPNNEWKTVQAGSRLLVDAETRYAMIELECLAAAWAMWKCRPFLEGLPTFELLIDHRPLIPILNDYPLGKLENKRLLLLVEKMHNFAFVARWIPGKENTGADALSRAPVDKASNDDQLGEGPKHYTARAAVNSITGSSAQASDIILEKVRAAAAKDDTMQQLHSTILHGFPNDKGNLPLPLRPFWAMREQLAVEEQDYTIVAGARVVVPRSVVSEILEILLKMHQAESKMRQRTCLCVYWPGMDVDIANAARNCDSCITRLPSLPAEPLRPHEAATRPFQFVHADVGEDNGHHFLTIVDTFSGWPFLDVYGDKKTTSHRLITSTRRFITTFGAPIKFWSDNASILASAEFQAFLLAFGIEWGSSTPYYAQSNGRAEKEISCMAKLVAGAKTNGQSDPNKVAQALILFQNAPRSGGASPAEIVFNSQIRDGMPVHRRAFEPEWQRPQQELSDRQAAAHERNVKYYNTGTHALSELGIGDHVLIQNPKSSLWDTKGVVKEVGPNRDYMVTTSTGKESRCNRRFLRQRIPVMPGKSPSTASSNQQNPLVISQQNSLAISQQNPLTISQQNPLAINQQDPPIIAPAAPPPPIQAAEPTHAAARRRPRRRQDPGTAATRRSTRTPAPDRRYDLKNPNSQWSSK